MESVDGKSRIKGDRGRIGQYTLLRQSLGVFRGS